MSNHTPAPWSVRKLKRNDEIVDCFVCANDVNGFAYDSEIMGDDEYHENIERKLADAHLIAAAPELMEALKEMIDAYPTPSSVCKERTAFEKAHAALAKAQGESK